MEVIFEVWIRHKQPPRMWMLFARAENRDRAETIVLVRCQRDQLRDYEIREFSEPSLDEPCSEQRPEAPCLVN